MCKLFIDDLRSPPDLSWDVVRSTQEGILYVMTNGCPNEISFDFCLAEGQNVMPFIQWLIAQDKEQNGCFFVPDFKYGTHSSSPSGRFQIMHTLDTYFKNQKS